jgi:hypothetical protein
MHRRGQMLAEVALVLPLFVLILLLTRTVSELGLARLKTQEAARLLAWKGLPSDKARVEASRALLPLARARLEKVQATRTGLKGATGDPLAGGWIDKTLGTSRAEVRISVPPFPWGGPRLERSAVHVVDLGRSPPNMEGWVKGRIGARVPGMPRTTP